MLERVLPLTRCVCFSRGRAAGLALDSHSLLLQPLLPAHCRSFRRPDMGGWRTQEEAEAWVVEQAQAAVCDVLDVALSAKLGAPPQPRPGLGAVPARPHARLPRDPH